MAEALSEQNYKHEFCVSDLYVALRMVPGVEIQPKSDQSKGLREDLAAKIIGKQVYFEVERGTQGMKRIEEKVERYLKLPGWFYVVFTVQDYRPNPFAKVEKSARQAGEDILNLLKDYGRGAQFLVTPHTLFLEDPLARVLISPTDENFQFEGLKG